MTVNKNKQRIIIVGAGFAGIKAALTLSKFNHLFHITLISRSENFCYYPTLLRTAVGGDSKLSIIPISKILKQKDINFILGSIKTVDKKSKNITLENNSTLEYDKLILALGEVTNYFDIPGLERYSHAIKSESQTYNFNKLLHDYLTENHTTDKNYLIIGAGATGIELASTLPAYLKFLMKRHNIHHHAIHVELIEASPTLLPRYPKDFTKIISHKLITMGVSLKLSCKVINQGIDYIQTNNEKIESKTVVWTAGVSNNPFYKNNQFLMNNHDKVLTDIYLAADDNIFVAGDNANTPYSGLAQTALHDGHFIAKNIIRAAHNKSYLPYKPKKPITVISVGPFWGAVLWGNIRLYGLIGAILRQLADIEGYRNILPLNQAIMLWLNNFKKQSRKCNFCDITSLKK